MLDLLRKEITLNHWNSWVNSMHIIFFFICLMGICYFFSCLHRNRKYDVTFGRVCRYEEETKAGITKYRPVLSYSVEGKKYKVNTGWKATVARKFAGMKFKIYYDPLNPEYAFVAPKRQAFTYIFIGFVIFIISLFIYFCIK